MNSKRLMQAILLANLITCATLATPVGPTKDPAKARAEDQLIGRKVHIRVYPNYEKDPNQYTLSHVPITNLHLKRAYIRAACAHAPEFANAVEMPIEQVEDYCNRIEDILQEVIESVTDLRLALDEAQQVAASLEQVINSQTAANHSRTKPSQQASRIVSLLSRSKSTFSYLQEALNPIPEAAETIASETSKLASSRSNLAEVLLVAEQIHNSVDCLKSKLHEMDGSFTSLLQKVRALQSAAYDETDRAAYTHAYTLILSSHKVTRCLLQLRQTINVVLLNYNRLRTTITAIAEGLDEKLKSVTILISPADQTDGVLVDYIAIKHYQNIKDGLFLWTNTARRERQKPFVFVDAYGQPVANTPVQIRFGSNRHHTQAMEGMTPTEPHIMACTIMLDAEGRADLPIIAAIDLHITYYVIHADCGPVPAFPASYTREGYRRMRISALPRDKWTTFVDALGRPMPNATVAIYRGLTFEDRAYPNPIMSQLDSEGRLKPPFSDARLVASCFVVSHPDYGTAIANQPQNRGPEEFLKTCIVPLVKIGTEAQARSIWGTVVDPQARPVPDAVIELQAITTPGGGSMIVRPVIHRYKTITDDGGSFSLYAPLEQHDQNDIKIVPLASTYSLVVKPPKERSLKKHYVNIKSGIESTIALEHIVPRRKAFHTFSFEDRDGCIADSKTLRTMTLHVKSPGSGPPGQTLVLHYDKWKNGGMFPTGTYFAYRRADTETVFEPVEITEDSPEHIVFRTRPIEE